MRHAEEHLAAALLAATTALIVAQLVLVQVHPRWASPLTTLVLALFFWATLLGVPAATRRGAHLSVGLLSRRLPVRWQAALQFFVALATVAFFLTLAVTGVKLCLDQARWHNRFLGTWCPDWAVAAGIPVAAALSVVRAIGAWREGRAAAKERGEA